MNTRSLLRKLANYYPQRLAESYDTVGLQCGQLKEQTNKIALALDFDEDVLKQLADFKPDLIITHHPFLFGGKERALFGNPEKESVYTEIMNKNIPVMAYHTNFDAGVKFGMNDLLMEQLGFENFVSLSDCDFMKGAILDEPMSREDFIKMVLKSFDLEYGLVLPYGKDVIKSCAIVGGGFSRGWRIAKDSGYDIYISGDCPHNVRRDIINAKYNYLDLPHEIERVFIQGMKKVLLSIDPTLEIKTIDHEVVPYVINAKN